MHANAAKLPPWALAGFAVLGALATLAVLAPDAQASHFRGGTLYAVPQGGLDITFEGRVSFRCSFFNSAGCPPGMIISGGTIQVESDTQQLSAANFVLRVVAYNPAKDWFQGVVMGGGSTTGVPYTLPGATDATGEPWRFSWSSGARLGSAAGGSIHVNNPNHAWRLEGDIDLGNDPPRPVVPPIVQCEKDELCEIDIPYIDGDGDVVVLRFSTSCEAQGTTSSAPPHECVEGTSPVPVEGVLETTPFAQPGHPECTTCGAAAPSYLDNVETQLEWDTTGATYYAPPETTYYSTQVMLHDGTVRVPMDFFIEIGQQITPRFTAPTACDQTLPVIGGGIVRLPIRAVSDDAARVVSVMPLEYPEGSTVDVEPGNPALGEFVWDTAGKTNGTYLIVLLAQDDLGNEGPPCIIRLILQPPPILDFVFKFTTTSPMDLTLDPVQFTDTSTMPAYVGLVPSWAWNFDDPLGPGSGAGPNPKHPFADGGKRPGGMDHWVCMIVYLDHSPSGYRWEGQVCKPVRVYNRPPIPALRVKPGAAPLYVEARQLGKDLDGTIVDRIWDWGDGQSGPGARVQGHAYEAPGRYTVCVHPIDDDGDTATACRDIIVEAQPRPGDFDRDGISDDQDNCVDVPNRDQADRDHDGEGDVCAEPDYMALVAVAEPAGPTAPGDADGDGVADAQDNCPAHANRLQADLDLDHAGDACDADTDGDGILEARLVLAFDAPHLDNCPAVGNADQADADDDGLGDACDPDTPQAASLALRAGGAGPARAGSTSNSDGAGLRWLALGGLATLGLAGVVVAAAWARRRWS